MAQPIEDPRELPAPEEPFDQRVVALARDLAYGVKVGDWEPAFTVIKEKKGEGLIPGSGLISEDEPLQHRCCSSSLRWISLAVGRYSKSGLR